MSDERHDTVSRRAYQLWEQEGGEHGRHEDHWHRAAEEVDREGDGAGATAPDGTTMPVATAIDAAGIGATGTGAAGNGTDAAQEPADSPDAPPPGIDDAAPSGSVTEPAGEPADSPVAATPPAAVAPKAPSKSRKPKTK